MKSLIRIMIKMITIIPDIIYFLSVVIFSCTVQISLYKLFTRHEYLGDYNKNGGY